MPGASPAQGITYIVQFPGIFRSIRSTLRGGFFVLFSFGCFVFDPNFEEIT